MAPSFWQAALRGNDLADDVPVVRWQICRFSPPSHVLIATCMCAGRPYGFCTQCAARQWLAGSTVHREYFAAPPTANSTDGRFEVQILSTEQTLSAGKPTVIPTLANAGIFVGVSCEQGICETCVTRVVEGEPDHRDSF